MRKKKLIFYFSNEKYWCCFKNLTYIRRRRRPYFFFVYTITAKMFRIGLASNIAKISQGIENNTMHEPASAVIDTLLLTLHSQKQSETHNTSGNFVPEKKNFPATRNKPLFLYCAQ